MPDEILMGAGSGAASGAAMGSMVLPGWGTAIGAGVGALAGGIAGAGQKSQRKAQEKQLKAQQKAIFEEITARNKDVGATRAAFGDVWSLGRTDGGADAVTKNSLGDWGSQLQTPSAFQDRAQTLLRHSQIAGGIDSQADAVRDAASSTLNEDAQRAAVATRAASLNRGLIGSSLDEGARKLLLSQFAGGRAQAADAGEQATEAGWQGIRSKQAQLEAQAAGGQRMGSLLASTNLKSEIAGANAQIPVTTFGNLLNTGINLTNAGVLSGAQGGQGFNAFRLPGLANTSTKNVAQGASTSKG